MLRLRDIGDAWLLLEDTPVQAARPNRRGWMVATSVLGVGLAADPSSYGKPLARSRARCSASTSSLTRPTVPIPFTRSPRTAVGWYFSRADKTAHHACTCD
jgi:hypothetical protein